MKAYSAVHCPKCGSKEFDRVKFSDGLPYVRFSCCGYSLKIYAAMRYSACCQKCGSLLIDIEDNVKAQVKIPSPNDK